MINYLDFMQIMGLSTHKNQLERRKQQHPNHFTEKDNKPYITKQYASFIVLSEMLNQTNSNLKGAIHE